SSRNGRRRRILFGRFLVGRASIIGGIKTGTLKDNAGAGAEEAFHLSVAPLWKTAKLFRTFAERLIPHRLESFEILPALGAGIFVSRHNDEGWDGKRRSEVCIKQSTIQAVRTGRTTVLLIAATSSSRHRSIP